MFKLYGVPANFNVSMGKRGPFHFCPSTEKCLKYDFIHGEIWPIGKISHRVKAVLLYVVNIYSYASLSRHGKIPVSTRANGDNCLPMSKSQQFDPAQSLIY